METSIHAIACNKLLILFATIAITGIVCSKGSELINIPDVVLFLIVGILLGPSVLKIIDISQFQLENQLILTFGSAFILYLGGKEVSLKVLKNVKISVFLLSTLGIVISSFFMAKIIGLNFQIGFMTCLLAGSIIASTDPATIVPIFNQVKIDKKVKQTVISESALNDATGAIMTVAILSIIMGGHFSIEENIYNLCIMVIVGVMVGLITGLVLLFLINDSPKGIFKDYTPIISILSVIIAYELSTYSGGSGYMSCFIVGLVTGNKQNFKMWLSQKHYDADCNVVETVGTICRMCIFIILGSQVQLNELFKYFIPALLSVLGLIFIVRPVCVLACTLVDRKAKWNKKQILFMMWVRETGVIPAALCGIITSMKVPGSEIISSIVFMTILITLILQGSTTKLLAKRLGLLELEVATNEDEITN